MTGLASFLERRPTCRRNRRVADRSTSAPTSGRLAVCWTRCCAGRPRLGVTTVTDVIAAVSHHQETGLARCCRRECPAHVRRLLQRCLAERRPPSGFAISATRSPISRRPGTRSADGRADTRAVAFRRVPSPHRPRRHERVAGDLSRRQDGRVRCRRRRPSARFGFSSSPAAQPLQLTRDDVGALAASMGAGLERRSPTTPRSGLAW